MVVRGALVTDACSLFDHLGRCGAIPTERQVFLDLMCAKADMEDGVVNLLWVPSAHMLADPLTKKMWSEIFERFRQTQRYSLVQTPLEAEEEKRRADLRRGQRQRRKIKMKGETKEDV